MDEMAKNLQTIDNNAELLSVRQSYERLQMVLNHKTDTYTHLQGFIERLKKVSVATALDLWLSNFNEGTKRNYKYYTTDMIKRGIILDGDVESFNHVAHEAIVDMIKKITDWSEGTRQVRAACYISFTAYLERITNGWFRRVHPSKLSANQTFFQVRDKCATKALKLSEWHRFISELHKINVRDSLIARCMLQGAKRISEVLDVTIDQINFENNIIRYRQKKTGGTVKEIPITYPASFMQEMASYIADTEKHRAGSNYVFVTRNGNPVTRFRCNFSFDAAGKQANIGKVSPHMLRATWVTLAKEQGVQDTEIMKVTGHTSSKMVYAYDKTSDEDNYSKKLVLI